jgi:hypothetical protein
MQIDRVIKILLSHPDLDRLLSDPLAEFSAILGSPLPGGFSSLVDFIWENRYLIWSDIRFGKVFSLNSHTGNLGRPIPPLLFRWWLFSHNVTNIERYAPAALGSPLLDTLPSLARFKPSVANLLKIEREREKMGVFPKGLISYRIRGEPLVSVDARAAARALALLAGDNLGWYLNLRIDNSLFRYIWPDAALDKAAFAAILVESPPLRSNHFAAAYRQIFKRKGGAQVRHPLVLLEIILDHLTVNFDITDGHLLDLFLEANETIFGSVLSVLLQSQYIRQQNRRSKTNERQHQEL